MFTPKFFFSFQYQMMLKGNWQLGIKTVGRLMDPDALLFYEFFAPSQKIQKGVLLIFQKVPQFKNRLGKKKLHWEFLDGRFHGNTGFAFKYPSGFLSVSRSRLTILCSTFISFCHQIWNKARRYVWIGQKKCQLILPIFVTFLTLTLQMYSKMELRYQPSVFRVHQTTRGQSLILTQLAENEIIWFWFSVWFWR